MHIQTYEDALSYIFQEELTNKYDVTQVQKADKALGHPHRAYQNIHIAGTNGKGSTAKMVFSILEKAGKKVGCFTSPHLVDVRERIQTQDGCISKKDFVRLLNKVLATKISLSYFELLTMIAFLYFQEKKCEYAVIEVGLG
jgi:dihydrofolate synthase/folylpolyglutamate synthase